MAELEAQLLKVRFVTPGKDQAIKKRYRSVAGNVDQKFSAISCEY